MLQKIILELKNNFFNSKNKKRMQKLKHEDI